MEEKGITFYERFCAAVDAGLLGESGIVVRTYGAMCRESKYSGRVEIGFEKIAEHLRRADDRDTRREISKAVKTLATNGFISVIAEGHGRGRQGIYMLVRMRGGRDLLSDAGGIEAKSLPPHGQDASPNPVGNYKGGQIPPLSPKEKGGVSPTVEFDRGGKSSTKGGANTPAFPSPSHTHPPFNLNPSPPRVGFESERGVGGDGVDELSRQLARSMSSSRTSTATAARVASPQQLELFVQESGEFFKTAPQQFRQRMLLMMGINAHDEFSKRLDLPPAKLIDIWRRVWQDSTASDKSAVMVSRLRGPRGRQRTR